MVGRTWENSEKQNSEKLENLPKGVAVFSLSLVTVGTWGRSLPVAMWRGGRHPGSIVGMQNCCKRG